MSARVATGTSAAPTMDRSASPTDAESRGTGAPPPAIRRAGRTGWPRRPPRRGSHGAAEIGVHEEEIEDEARGDHGAQAHGPRHAHDQPGDLERLHRDVGGDGLEVSAEEEERDVLQHEGEAEREEKNAHGLARPLAGEERRDEEMLNGEPA